MCVGHRKFFMFHFVLLCMIILSHQINMLYFSSFFPPLIFTFKTSRPIWTLVYQLFLISLMRFPYLNINLNNNKMKEITD